MFTTLLPDRSGLSFQNTVNDTDSLNFFDYLYYYNGGGVAIGDINNDGLADIYLVSNQGENKLFLNKGDMHFEDITASAHVGGTGNWKTGVTMADVNNDGLLDIYVSEVGGYLSFKGKNELFINQGNGHFKEEGHEYGLDATGFNTQAVFFDYDHDGFLDMFLVNHSVHGSDNFRDASVRNMHSEVSGDKLFHNEPVVREGKGTGGQGDAPTRHFREVTASAGIYSSAIGYGLSVAIGDLNNDGWPDIYVSNDFHENDYYYLNNRHGGFTEINREAFGHESRFSMGSDIADVNNDGWLDIITLDMLPEDEKTLKSSAGDDAPDIYTIKYDLGYNHQNSRNCLQLNTGAGYHFSEIGLYAGIAATDWSWSPLAADFDNDGIKDLFISNGIVRRPNDLDYLKFKSGSINRAADRSLDLTAIRALPEGKVPNYIFKGSNSLRYIDKSLEWGMSAPTISTGAAYADLDNDGDLDIVVNNINSPAVIYRNESNKFPDHHSLDIRLVGAPSNPFGIGARVQIWQKDKMQMCELESTRGFESSSLQYLHFGIGNDTMVDRLVVTWPDGKDQEIQRLHGSKILILDYRNASILKAEPGKIPIKYFNDISSVLQPAFRHKEDVFNDFAMQPLIPHLVSTEGPKIAVADVNGDGLEDFFICGAKKQPGALYLQTKDGRFIKSPQPAIDQDSSGEDVDAIFFDADNDGHPDLYLVTGGNETAYEDSSVLDRLYINDGKGGFTRSTGLPLFYGNKSVAAAADIDHDGDLDLFIGGRVVAGSYGMSPDSYLLLNDGHGRFTLATDALAPGLRKAGMVTGAVWTDTDQDGWKDLVLVGEWMPVTVFRNHHGHLINETENACLAGTNGLWNCLSLADPDHNGREDLLAGNRGLNSKLCASATEPLLMYLSDFSNNGMIKQLVVCNKNGRYYPFAGKEELEKQIPSIRKKYPGYASFAGQTIDEIFPGLEAHAVVLKANTLASTVFINKGGGKFASLPMCRAMQYGPIYSLLAADFDQDGLIDWLAGGNLYGATPFEGRYDALGIPLCPGDGKGGCKLQPELINVPDVQGEVRDMQLIHLTGNRKALLIARNNDTPVLWEVKK
ncbi:VCBS repeat-containing protein [Flavitalea flava]